MNTIDLKRHDPAHPVQDIVDLGFWEVDYRFLTNKISSDGILFPGNSGLPGDEALSIANLATNKCRPNIWLSTDGLAKSFYSTIMTDLGQTTTGPNILLNETALDYYTRNFTDMFSHIANAIPGPGTKSYAEAKNDVGSLGTTPAVITTKYLCQVPQQKSMGSLLVSILMADIVFMQLLWKVFTVVTATILTRKKRNGESVSVLCLTAIAEKLCYSKPLRRMYQSQQLWLGRLGGCARPEFYSYR